MQNTGLSYENKSHNILLHGVIALHLPLILLQSQFSLTLNNDKATTITQNITVHLEKSTIISLIST